MFDARVHVPEHDMHELGAYDVEEQGEDRQHLDEEEDAGDEGHHVGTPEVVEQVVFYAGLGQGEGGVEHDADEDVSKGDTDIRDGQVARVVLRVLLVLHDGDDAVVDEKGER